MGGCSWLAWRKVDILEGDLVHARNLVLARSTRRLDPYKGALRSVQSEKKTGIACSQKCEWRVTKQIEILFFYPPTSFALGGLRT